MFGLFIMVLERDKFVCNKMAGLVPEVEETSFCSICIQESLRGLKNRKLLV